jgi:restriction system protein
MARRRKDNGIDIFKLSLLLVALLAYLLANGDLKKVPGTMVGIVVVIVAIALGLGAIALVIYLLTRAKTATQPETFPGVTYAPRRDDTTFMPPAPGIAEPLPDQFTLSLVRSLEWRRFEILVEGLLNGEGFIASRIRAGADGGVDLVLRQEPDGPVVGIVQCKTWTSSVGVKPVRELFGVMAGEGVQQGHFVCCGGYTQEAREWAKYKPMVLVTGEELVVRLNNLPEEKRDALLAEVTAGDYTTPTCPSCDVKMVRRSGKNGEFWGCKNFPRGCRSTLNCR